jgi:hypothetical protein
MTEAGPARIPAPAPPSARGTARWARALGVLSVVVFFVPLIAPLVQATTLVYVLSAAWRGSLDRISVIVGAAGAALGFVLFLATGYIWIV